MLTYNLRIFVASIFGETAFTQLILVVRFKIQGRYIIKQHTYMTTWYRFGMLHTYILFNLVLTVAQFVQRYISSSISLKPILSPLSRTRPAPSIVMLVMRESICSALSSSASHFWRYSSIYRLPVFFYFWECIFLKCSPLISFCKKIMPAFQN